MLTPNPPLAQFSGKQAHLKRREQALFSRHGPLNLELDGLRQGACIGDEYGQMLPRASSAGRIYRLANCSGLSTVLK
jgi:hypothetical protein